jgi:hypothetical protein
VFWASRTKHHDKNVCLNFLLVVAQYYTWNNSAFLQYVLILSVIGKILKEHEKTTQTVIKVVYLRLWIEDIYSPSNAFVREYLVNGIFACHHRALCK